MYLQIGRSACPLTVISARRFIFRVLERFRIAFVGKLCKGKPSPPRLLSQRLQPSHFSLPPSLQTPTLVVHLREYNPPHRYAWEMMAKIVFDGQVYAGIDECLTCYGETGEQASQAPCLFLLGGAGGRRDAARVPVLPFPDLYCFDDHRLPRLKTILCFPRASTFFYSVSGAGLAQRWRWNEPQRCQSPSKRWDSVGAYRRLAVGALRRPQALHVLMGQAVLLAMFLCLDGGSVGRLRIVRSPGCGALRRIEKVWASCGRALVYILGVSLVKQMNRGRR